MLRIDITGQRFGKLLVVQFLRMKGTHAIFKCLCDCGNETEAYSQNIRSGHTSSCGCIGIAHKKDFAQKGLTHGQSKHPLYISWVGMRNRCYFTKHNRYALYGGKGIKVCEEWKDDFPVFFEWGMANGWEKGKSIDRKENDKDYSPENCRFATVKEQNRNRTNNVKITYQGETLVAQDWASRMGVNGQTIIERFRKGWSLHEVMNGRSKT